MPLAGALHAGVEANQEEGIAFWSRFEGCFLHRRVSPTASGSCDRSMAGNGVTEAPQVRCTFLAAF